MTLLRKVVLGVLLAGLVLVGITGRAAVLLFGWADGAEPDAVVGQPMALSAPGPYPVGLRQLVMERGPAMHALLWYPAQAPAAARASITYSYGMKLFGGNGSVALAAYPGAAARDAKEDLSGGPYPLVVLSPGFAIGASTYAWLAEHLASYGLAVIAMDHGEELDPGLLWRATVDRPRDTRSVIAQSGDLGRLVDATRVAVVGHSYGGYTALAAAGARLDSTRLREICEGARPDDPIIFQCDALVPHIDDMADAAELGLPPDGPWPSWGDARVDAAVALAGDAVIFGEAGMAEVGVPVMAIGGTADADAPYQWGTRLAYESAGSQRKVEIGLEGAAHMIFTGPCEVSRRLLTIISEPFCADPAWDKAQAHDIVRHFTTAFLMAERKDDSDAARALAEGPSSSPQVRYAATGY